jgi:hypothetical protein
VPMGTNKRYAEQLDRKMDERILERIAKSGKLATLTAAELQLDKLVKTIDPMPKVVNARVRFGETPIRSRRRLACGHHRPSPSGSLRVARSTGAGSGARQSRATDQCCWVWNAEAGESTTTLARLIAKGQRTTPVPASEAGAAIDPEADASTAGPLTLGVRSTSTLVNFNDAPTLSATMSRVSRV